MNNQQVKQQLELNNIKIEHRESDNFINATQLCKAGGKEFGHWLELKSTKELVKTLEETLIDELSDLVIPNSQISNQISNNSDNEEVKNIGITLIDVKRGNSKKFSQGSWIHPDLAVALAQWISPAFAIQVARWVRELLITGHVSIESQKTNQELINLQTQLELKNIELAEKDEALEIAESKNLDLVSKIENIHLHKLEGFIYLASNKQYALNNHFRLGQTMDLTKRIIKYRTGRTVDDSLHYVFVYKTENIVLLEYIIRALLKPYRDESSTDMYTIHWSVIQPFMHKVCNLFHTGIIPNINELIINNTSCNKPAISPPKIDLNKDLLNDNANIILNNGHELRPQYYEQILELYKDYNITIYTERDTVHTVFDIIDVECPHQRRQIQVRALLNKLGCNDCIKNKLSLDKNKELLSTTLESFEDYNVIELIDETSANFLSLGKMDQKRKITQNIIINKLAEENIRLTTNYANYDGKISLVCSHAHNSTTSWNALCKLTESYCRPCRTAKRTVAAATVKKQTSEEDVIKIAKDLNWTHIRKTGTAGLMEWKCPNGHTVCKVLRELKRASCPECSGKSKI